VLASRTSDGRGRCCGSSFPLSSGRHWRSVGRKPSRPWCQCQHRRRRCPPWRCFLGCFLLGLCLPGGNTSPVLRRSDGGGIGAVSFSRALLWKSRAYLACGLMASQTLEDWWFGRCLSLKLSFLFLCRSGCIFLFASLPRYEVLSLKALV
jgi:hypothetical protein